MKDPAVRQKLLLATIECIEKYGIEGCTVRAVAAEAKVAFSALHYYFESKEQMVDEALALAIQNSYSDLDELWVTRANGRDALRGMLMFLFDGALRYPGVTRASLRPMLVKGLPEGYAHDVFNRVVRRMVADMRPRAEAQARTLALWLISAFSTVLYLGSSPQAYLVGCGFDFADAASREAQVVTLLEGMPPAVAALMTAPVKPSETEEQA